MNLTHIVRGAALALCLQAYQPAAAEPDEPPLPGEVETSGNLPAPLAAGKASPRYVTMVIGGDLGLGGSGQSVDPRGARKHGRLHGWQSLTAGLKPLIDGDINFANLETVVTANNRLRPASKTFNFKSHPQGVRHLVKMGFNVFSLSNNHAIDYGRAGMRETLKYVAAFRSDGLLAAPGLGLSLREAGGPEKFQFRDSTFLISALGIGGPRPSGGGPGILHYNAGEGYRNALTWLASEPADYRILSVHYGAELAVRPTGRVVRKFRDEAVREAGVDLIIGHHAHVAAGVQEVGGKLVFYGLGNLLHPGMQNMARFNRCRDYGIVAKLHLAGDGRGRLRAGAIELRVLTDMHLKARAMGTSKAKQRLAVLNRLARGLDHEPSGAKGVRFRARRDGSGLACLPGAAAMGGPIAALCRTWSDLPKPAVSSTSCGTRVATARSQRRGAARKRARPRKRNRSVFQSVFGN